MNPHTIVAAALIGAGVLMLPVVAWWAVREVRAERAANETADAFLADVMGRAETTVRRSTYLVTEQRENEAVEAFMRGTATDEDRAIVETIVDLALWEHELEERAS